MPTLQIQARALGDPTRHQIFRYLDDADRPVDVAELTDHLGLNHNAIRQHLAKLVDAELVREGSAPPAGRGRPRLQYTIDPATDSRWGVTGPFERLALLLTEIVRSDATPVEVGRRAGRRQRLGATTDSSPLEALVDQMARQGFEPDVSRSGDDFDLTLQTCPFASAALSDPDTVCQLHLGLAQGVAESVGGIAIDELVPKDPRRARCRLRGHMTSPASASPPT